MSWTTVSDLTMINYQAGIVIDNTKFHNDAQLLGPIVSQQGFVSFQGGDAQLEIPVRDESLQRFTAIRVEALIRPSGIPHRLNIVEGWMSFAFFVEANQHLMAGIYDGQNWVAVTAATPVAPQRWSRVMFEYDGISIGKLSVDDATVGSSVTMPIGMHQPQQVIAIGHWPRGDARYTFVGDIGHVRIARRDYEDFGRDSLSTALCLRRLTLQQASALRELQILYSLLDAQTQAELRKCAARQTERLLQFMRRWRADNMRNIAKLNDLGEGLRSAWCCQLDSSRAAKLLLEFMRERAGAPGSPERKQFEADYQEIVDMAHMCLRSEPSFDRMRQLLATAIPELASAELSIEQLKNVVAGS